MAVHTLLTALLLAKVAVFASGASVEALRNLTRDPGQECVYGVDTYQCGSLCTAVEYCNRYGIWTVQEECSSTQVCYRDDEAVDPADRFKCGTKGEVTPDCPERGVCTDSGNYPLLGDCNSYTVCDGAGSTPEIASCSSGQFDPAKRACGATYIPSDRVCQIVYPECNEYDENESFAVATNPSLYYTCTKMQPVWKKCENGVYVPQLGTCHGLELCPGTCTASWNVEITAH